MSASVWLDVPSGLVAVIVIVYSPPVPASGVPAMLPVPLPLSVKLSPPGRPPACVSPGSG